MTLYLNGGERQKDMIDIHVCTHNVSSCEIKVRKKHSDMNGIQTHDLCDTGAVQIMVFHKFI